MSDLKLHLVSCQVTADVMGCIGHIAGNIFRIPFLPSNHTCTHALTHTLTHTRVHVRDQVITQEKQILESFLQKHGLPGFHSAWSESALQISFVMA